MVEPTQPHTLYMYIQSLRQSQARQQHVYMPKENSFFPRAASGGTWIREILRTRQTLYQLSHRGSSAEQAESLNVIQGQRRLFPDKQGNSHLCTCTCSRPIVWWCTYMCTFVYFMWQLMKPDEPGPLHRLLLYICTCRQRCLRTAQCTRLGNLNAIISSASTYTCTSS